MSPSLRLLVATAIVAVLATAPRPVAAQAFTSPQGIGSVTLAWQWVDNTGHRLSDGTLFPGGNSVTTSVLVEVEYGVTDRLAITFGVPYVFARYTDDINAPISGLPIDICRCWQSSLQDLSLAARYRLGHENWAVTPLVGFGRPTHDYAYAGEAVVGRNLQEARVGAMVGLRLVDLLPKASVHTGYTYTFVEKPLNEIKDRKSTRLNSSH